MMLMPANSCIVVRIDLAPAGNLIIPVLQTGKEAQGVSSSTCSGSHSWTYGCRDGKTPDWSKQGRVREGVQRKWP